MLTGDRLTADSITLNYEPDGNTLVRFHSSTTPIRYLCGPIGSGKSTAATWEVCYFIPTMLKELYGITKSRWAIVRNTYSELLDSTMKTVLEWFPWGHMYKQERRYELSYNGMEIELFFRACDRPEDTKKFKSFEITGYWVEEASEVSYEIKKILKSRIGRFPPKKEWPLREPLRFGIETSNPPDIESRDYEIFFGSKKLENHEGFWQKPGENLKNLRENYYEDLRRDYADDPDWIERYIEGKPGVRLVGKNVYNNFRFDFHVSKTPIQWLGDRYTIYRGWDNTGNRPACVIGQIPIPGMLQIMRERWDDRSGIIDFAERVQAECNALYPNATYVDWGDPAGEAHFSKHNGGLTSNAQMMRDIGINIMPSIQEFDVRRESVEILLRTIIQGEPALQIDPSCTRLINGFLGGYGYKRLGNMDIFQKRPFKNSYCVDTETECLTVNGWKKYLEIEQGEELPCYNTKTGKLEMGKVKQVNYFPWKQEVLSFSNNELTMVMTPNHRCIATRKLSHHTEPHTTYTPFDIVKAKDLNSAHGILRAAREKTKSKKIAYSNWFIKVCAWVSAEGTYRKDDSIIIAQSLSHNPEYVKSIDNLLVGDRCLYSRLVNKRKKDTIVTWRIVRELAESIKQAMPNKYPSMEFIYKMTNKQRLTFLYEFMRGDGDGRDRQKYGAMPEVDVIARKRDFFVGDSTPRIRQKKKETIDALQIMATLAGMPTSVHKGISRGKEWWSITFLKKRNVFWIYNAKKETIEVTGTWCPTTTLGTWVARRHGQVFITGNSHVHDALQYLAARLFANKTMKRARKVKKNRSGVTGYGG